MSPPRILFITPQPFFQWRGSPIRVRANLQALSDLGYRVDAIVLPFGEDVELPNVTLHRVASLPGVSEIAIGPSIPKLLFNFLVLAKARSLMKQHTYAMVHAVEESAFFISGTCRRRNIPLIYEKHSDPASYRKGGVRNLVMSLYARMEALSMKRACQVIATGAGLADAVRQRCPGTPCTHLFDLPSSSVDPEPAAVEAKRQELHPDPERVVATYVGSFAVYQGIDLLFKSIPQACRDQQNLHIAIVGGDPRDISERNAFLMSEGCADRVHFLGKMPPEELAAVLAASDLLLSPRISGHNTPLKVLDYFRAGQAIVATDTESNRLILDETTAVFSPPEPEAFAGILVEAAGNADLRARLSRAGRKLIEDTYNFQNYRDTLGTIYQAAISPGIPT